MAQEKEEPDLEEGGGEIAFKLRTTHGTRIRGSVNYFIIFYCNSKEGGACPHVSCTSFKLLVPKNV